MKTAIINGKVITEDKVFSGGVISENGKIIKIYEGNILPISTDRVIDAKGKYISPGFIDIHTHGAGGHDFMDGTEEAFIEAAKSHMRFGTTSLIPTTLTSGMDELLETFRIYKKAKKNMVGGPNLLGLHLEGPYFSVEQKGAQDERYIKDPEREEYLNILERSSDIVRWTIAPERDGACEMARELVKRNILPSVGHTNATCQEITKGFENGFSLMTHFYSGMSMVRRINAYRVAGAVEAGYLLDDMYVEVIADGKHLPADILKLIYKVKGPERICLVTDSMRAAGQNTEKSILGSLKNGVEVLVEDGVAKLMERTAFAGSVATTDRLVRTMVTEAEVPLREAVNMITINPAKVMKLDEKKGSIAVGKDADIIIFDDNVIIEKVMVKGALTYDCYQ